MTWSEYDLVECLGVEPEIDLDEQIFFYEMLAKNLRLQVIIFELENSVKINLYQNGVKTELVSLRLFVKGGICYKNDKRGDYLEFIECIVVSNRSPIEERNEVFDGLRFPNQVDLELFTYPEISIRFV